MSKPRHLATVCIAAAMCLSTGLLSAGCGIGALVGGMASSAERQGSKTVKAKYSGLEGKSFAVIVAADRGIQADHTEIVSLVTREVTRRLVEHCGASGVVPAEEVLKFQYQRPGWVAMPVSALAKELEVQRLVYIDLRDYALTEPGNPYLWAGSAVAAVNVLEADGALGNDFAFRELVRVKFPDQEGLSEAQIPRQTLELELSRRLINRASWIFFDHEEPNVIKY